MAAGLDQGDLREDELGQELNTPKSLKDHKKAGTSSPDSAPEASTEGSGGASGGSPVAGSGGAQNGPGKSAGESSGGIGRAAQMAGQFVGKNRKKLLIGGGLGLGVIVPIAIFIAFLFIFKLDGIEKLYIDYQFTKVHRALGSRAKRLAKEAKTRAAGLKDTLVDPAAPVADQIASLNAEEVDKINADPAEAKLFESRVNTTELSDASTGKLIDAQFGIDRTQEPVDGKGKTPAEVEKAVKEADRQSIQGDAAPDGGVLNDVQTKELADEKIGMSPEQAIAAELKGADIFGLASKVSLAVTVTTFYCMGHDIWSETIGKIGEKQVGELVKLAARSDTAADAQKANKSTAAQVDAQNKGYDDGKTSYTQSASYRRDTGQAVTAKNPDLNPAIIPFRGGDVSTLISVLGKVASVPGAAQACPVLLNPGFQVFAAAAETLITAIGALVTGGQDVTAKVLVQETLTQSIKAVASREFLKVGVVTIGAAEAMNYLSASMAAAHAGASVSGTEEPIQHANKNDAGHDIMAQESIRLIGGRLLSDQESDTIKNAQLRAEADQTSVIARVFDITNPRSTANIALASIPSSAGGMVRGFGSFFGSIFSASSWVSVLNSLQPAASAAGVGDPYHIPQYGFTDAELNRFGVLDNAKYVEAHPELATKYGDCFTGTLVEAYNNNDAKCLDKSDDMLHYRLYLLDKSTIRDFAVLYNKSSSPTQASTGSLPSATVCPGIQNFAYGADSLKQIIATASSLTGVPQAVIANQSYQEAGSYWRTNKFNDAYIKTYSFFSGATSPMPQADWDLSGYGKVGNARDAATGPMQLDQWYGPTDKPHGDLSADNLATFKKLTSEDFPTHGEVYFDSAIIMGAVIDSWYSNYYHLDWSTEANIHTLLGHYGTLGKEVPPDQITAWFKQYEIFKAGC